MKHIELLKINLMGFRAFKTSPIKKVIITFDKVLQQLVSTNGSGKTTFLGECSLSPIDKEMYHPNGGRAVMFKVDGVIYLFKSTHRGCQLTNMDTNTVLTQGKTPKHYNELVNNLFGYTDYKWRLITGQIRFTSLSKIERQKWIETISGIDFEYPFKLYNLIRGRISGVRRAIKEYDAELVSSNDRLLTDDDRIEKKSRLAELNDLVTSIIECKGATTLDSNLRHKIEELRQLDVELKHAKSKVLDNGVNFQHLNVDSFEEFKLRHIADNAELDALSTKFETTKRELKEKISLRNHLLANDKFDVTAARAMRSELEPQLEEANALIGSKFSDSPKDALKSIIDNEETMLYNINLDIMGSVGLNLVLDISVENLRKARVDLTSLNLKLVGLESDLEHTDNLIADTKNGSTITCPKCEEIFKEGGNELHRLEKRSESLNNDISIVKSAKSRASSIVSDADAILRDNDTVANIIRKHINYRPVDTNAVKALDGTHTLNDVIDILKADIEDAKCRYKIQCYTLEIGDLDAAISNHERLTSLGDNSDISNRCDELDDELVGIRLEREELVARIKSRAVEGNRLRAYIKELDNLDSLIEIHGIKMKQVATEVYNFAVSNLLEDLQCELGAVRNIITDDSINVGIRDKLSNLLKRNRDELTILVDFEKAINPSTGLIAEQLTSYCDIFSSYSSNILSTIWGYDMEILSPEVHEVKGVNYDFPLSVKETDIISDIRKGSKSQCSIIDLAITIASRELLKSTKQMIILDEIGSGFDTIHNVNLGEFMHKFICESDSSNIMVVHHDEAIRGMLGDCDVICFDPSNVVLEDGYNRKVEITYDK